MGIVRAQADFEVFRVMSAGYGDQALAVGRDEQLAPPRGPAPRRESFDGRPRALSSPGIVCLYYVYLSWTGGMSQESAHIPAKVPV
jgi:hypothetical protein